MQKITKLYDSHEYGENVRMLCTDDNEEWINANDLAQALQKDIFNEILNHQNSEFNIDILNNLTQFVDNKRTTH